MISGNKLFNRVASKFQTNLVTKTEQIEHFYI